MKKPLTQLKELCFQFQVEEAKLQDVKIMLSGDKGISVGENSNISIITSSGWIGGNGGDLDHECPCSTNSSRCSR